jgi:hypothetical protein
MIWYQRSDPSPFVYQCQVQLNIKVKVFVGRNFTLNILCKLPTIYSNNYSLQYSDYFYGYNLNILSFR